jgi:predicted amidohydrolase
VTRQRHASFFLTVRVISQEFSGKAISSSLFAILRMKIEYPVHATAEITHKLLNLFSGFENAG